LLIFIFESTNQFLQRLAFLGRVVAAIGPASQDNSYAEAGFGKSLHGTLL